MQPTEWMGANKSASAVGSRSSLSRWLHVLNLVTCSTSRSQMSSASSSSPAAYVLEDGGLYARLGRDTNQARGLAQFALDFVSKKIGAPDAEVLKRTELFHTDSVFCGLSALALGTNAPTVLRTEALEYEIGAKSPLLTAKVFGSTKRVVAEKAIVANVSAVREWDSNGTVFGFNPRLGAGHMAGEFGHNDFYQVSNTNANTNSQSRLRQPLCPAC
jgi:hypothetical protein